MVHCVLSHLDTRTNCIEIAMKLVTSTIDHSHMQHTSLIYL